MEQMIRSAMRHSLKLFQREPWWAEFWSGMTAIAWAGLSYASVSQMEDWPSMRILVSIGDETAWHLFGFLLGLLQLASLVSETRWCRWFASIALCWFWTVLTIGVWVAVPWAPATAVYAGWCGVNLFSILRLLRVQPG